MLLEAASEICEREAAAALATAHGGEVAAADDDDEFDADAADKVGWCRLTR